MLSTSGHRWSAKCCWMVSDQATKYEIGRTTAQEVSFHVMLLLHLSSCQHNCKHKDDRTMEYQSNVTSASTTGGKEDVFTKCTKFINLDF